MTWRRWWMAFAGLAALAFFFEMPPVRAAQVDGSAPRLVPADVVGCPSDGQTGPEAAPHGAGGKGADGNTPVAADVAARLVLYTPANGPAVLGPRGWSCCLHRSVKRTTTADRRVGLPDPARRRGLKPEITGIFRILLCLWT